uniref:Uncharacterized protein n=1 Tax=Oryza nivara TaxID=4536 RepID=A0A0E0HGB8_ORYNI
MNRIGGDSTQLRWNLQSKPASVCELKTGFIPMPLTIGSTSFVGVAILELIRALLLLFRHGFYVPAINSNADIQIQYRFGAAKSIQIWMF